MSHQISTETARVLLSAFLVHIRADSHDAFKQMIWATLSLFVEAGPVLEQQQLDYVVNLELFYAIPSAGGERLRASLEDLFYFAREHLQEYKNAAFPVLDVNQVVVPVGRQQDGIPSISDQMPSSNPRIMQVLAAAGRDLDNANYNLGILFNPLRSLVLRPAVHVANFALPPLAYHIPLADNIMSTVLQISADACKTVYHATHAEQDNDVVHERDEDFPQEQQQHATKQS